MMKKQDTILINNIYTGDYTNKNIGHEIINSYKPDNGDDYYVYISPHGHVVRKWDDKIKTILFTRNAGKDRLEVIAKADICGEEQENFTKNRSYLDDLKLKGSKEFDEQKNEWKDLAKSIDEEFINFNEKYQNWERECRKEIKDSKDLIIEELIKKFPVPQENITIKDKYKKHTKYKEFVEKNKNLLDTIQTWENNYDNWKEKYFEYFKNFAIKNHLPQVQYIYKNEIKYGGKYLCDIFEKNEFDALATYYGFKTKNLTKPKYPIYLKYEEYTEGKNKNKIEYGDSITEEDEKCNIISRTYHFRHVKLANQRCYKFFNKEEFKDDHFYKFKKEFEENEENNFEEIKRLIDNSNDIDNYKKSFLVMIKKQYDELSYSNMFYHFFNNNKNLFIKFANEVLLEKDDLINEEDIHIYEVQREYKNIDLLIITDTKIFIIENKIKSGINGIEHDPYNEDKYCNQLTKYWHIIENDYKGKDIHPFIFKPDYNEIEKTKLYSLIDKAKDKALKGQEQTNKESTIIEKAKKDKSIIEKYCTINYSKLYEFFNNHKSDINDEFTEQFLLSLEIHKENHENIIEKDMELKFREAISK